MRCVIFWKAGCLVLIYEVFKKPSDLVMCNGVYVLMHKVAFPMAALSAV